MSDLEVLLLVLALIYGWDCLLWVRRGSVVFSTWLGRRWRCQMPSTLAGNARGGFVVAAPLPPLGTILSAAPPPISACPEGVLGFVSGSLDPQGRPPQSGRWIPWAELDRLEVRAGAVWAGGRELCRADGEAAAAALVARLKALRGASPEERPRELDAWVRAMFDADAARRRWDDYRAVTRGLRWGCNLYWLTLLGVVPAALLSLGPGRTWVYLVGLVAIHAGWVTWQFRRAHALLHPEAGDERFTQTMVVLLSPPSGVRALDGVARPVFARHHPVTVAMALGDRAMVARLASKALRELRHPARPVAPAGNAVVLAAELDWRTRLESGLVRALHEWDLDPATLLAPPQRQEAANRSWCPRCLQQFTLQQGVCRGCGGIPLQPFDEETAKPRPGC